MEYYCKILCVTYEELTINDSGDPVIAYNTLKSLIKRGNVQRIKRGGGEGSCALIVYSSLPEKYQKRFVEKYGDPVKLLKEKLMKDTIRKIDDKARAFYEAFEYELNGVQTRLSEKLKDEYTNNASVLNTLIYELLDKTSLTKMYNNPRRDIWDIIIGSCENLRKEYKHTLPNNLARLKDKIREYKKPMTYNGTVYPHNYLCIISGKIGNKSTLKINEEVGELLIALKCSRNPVYTFGQIFERFNQVELPRHNARVTDEKEIWKLLKSEKSMREWFNRPENLRLWYGEAAGSLKERQLLSIKLNTELASCRDARWEGDGTKLNLYYRDDDGRRCTCTVYEVIDTYSEALLGYWIADRENYMQQYHAFRMAVQATRRHPYEIVTDNQGGAKTKKMRDFMQAISHIARPTKPNNPQSKTIESVLGRFQQQVLHQHWAFTGQNVTAKKDSSKPNLEFVEENKDKLPTLAELKEKYIELREMWNGQRAMLTTETILKHPKTGIGRMEMYLNSMNESAKEITEREMAESFWLWTDKPSTFNPDGIKIEIDKQEYKYDVFATDEVNTPDVVWRRRNLYRKFWVKYDPYDMSSVKLYWEDKAGGLRFERVASPPVKVHRVIQDQQDGEAKYIRMVLGANKQEQVCRYLDAQEIMWKHGTAPEQNGLHSPKLSGFTDEEMIEVNLQLERRISKYKGKSIAQTNKDISMMTYEDAAVYDESEYDWKTVVNGGNKFDYKKSLSKI
jgi:hypothetical protein